MIERGTPFPMVAHAEDLPYGGASRRSPKRPTGMSRQEMASMAEVATGAPRGAGDPGIALPAPVDPGDRVPAPGGAVEPVSGLGAEVEPGSRPIEPVTGAVARAAEPVIGAACTQAQLRRFIKSRPYVPMHELRRRFEMNGAADDVTPIQVAEHVVYVGLPDRESQFIAELVRIGDIGVELCHDPPVPIVVGVYAMRPISR